MTESVDVLMWKGKFFRDLPVDRELHRTNDCGSKENDPIQMINPLIDLPSAEWSVLK